MPRKVFLAGILIAAVSCSFGFAEATTLFGGVQHSESLPPANQLSVSMPAPAPPIQKPIELSAPPQPAPNYQNGIMGSNAIPADDIPPEPNQERLQTTPRVNIEWYQIPKTMAGTWYKKGDFTESVKDLRTGIITPVNRFTDDEVKAQWGHQFDKDGNIWHANIMPFERDGMTNGQQVRFLILSLKAELLSPSELVSRTRTIITESQHGTVTKVFQQESLNHYYVSERQIVNRSSNRDFTYQGSAVRDGYLKSVYDKVAAFQPIPSLDGIDLARSLESFLQSRSR